LEIGKALEEAKQKSEKRNFVQSMDLIVNFTGLDLSKPDNRIDLEVVLPKGRGRQLKVCAIAGDELVPEAKRNADRVLTRADVESLGRDKKALKKIADEFDFFLCQADLMPLVGKNLGQVLAPRGKMPKPVPPNIRLDQIVARLRSTVRLKTKGKQLPTIHAVIGTEEMPNEDLLRNAEAVINSLKEKLPNREGNIRSIFIKTSMGPVTKVALR
jgi:large subunit ribosomal protein L1